MRFTNLEVCPSFVSSPSPIPLFDRTNWTDKINYNPSFPSLSRGTTSEDLPTPRPTLHRPDLRPRADLHDIFPDGESLCHLRHLPILKVTLRRVLHERALRALRRYRSSRASPSRARLPRCHRLAPRPHPRGLPALLRQPCRALRRQGLHRPFLLFHLLRIFHAAPTTTSPSDISTPYATNTTTDASTSSTGDTPGSNPGISADEMIFDSPEHGGGKR